MTKYKHKLRHHFSDDKHEIGKINHQQKDEDGLTSPDIIQRNEIFVDDKYQINCGSSKESIKKGITVIVNNVKKCCDEYGVRSEDEKGKFTFVSINENHNVIRKDNSRSPGTATRQITRNTNDPQQKENKKITKSKEILINDDQQSESGIYGSDGTLLPNRQVNFKIENTKLPRRRYNNKKQEETSRRLMIGTPTSTTATRANTKLKKSHQKRISIESYTVDVNHAATENVKNKENKKLAKRLTLMKNLLSVAKRKLPPPSQYVDDTTSSIMNIQNNKNNSSNTSVITTSRTTDLLHPLANMNHNSKAILLQRRRTLTGENNIVIPGGWEIQHQKNMFQGNRDLDELSFVSSSVDAETDVYDALRRCKYLRIPQHLTVDN